MVVAARAGEGRTQEGGRRRPDDVVQFVGPLVGGEDGVRRLHLIEGSGDEEAGRRIDAELVARELFADEPIVRHVSVERLDDVVAVGPGVGPGEVGLEAVGFGEARHVQPMAGPFLAEARRGQQAVDHRCVSPVRRVRDEGGHFLRRGRQSGDIEVGPTDEHARVGEAGHRQSFGLQSCGDEVVDRAAFGRSAHRLVGPVVEAGIAAGGKVGGVLRPDRALGDPLAHLLRLGGRERFALGRHLLVFVLRGDAVEEERLGRVAGDEGRTRFAALEGMRLRVEPEVRLVLLRTVAFDAPILQKRSDFPVEVHGRAQAGRGEQQEGDGGGAGHGTEGWGHPAAGRPFIITLF